MRASENEGKTENAPRMASLPHHDLQDSVEEHHRCGMGEIQERTGGREAQRGTR